MFMQISRILLCATALAVAGCSSEPDNRELAAVEADQTQDAAAAGRVYCALGGSSDFALNCSMEQIASSEGTILVLGRADAGYRRFRITRDGRGVVAADGAELATVTLIDNGLIEVAVANDRYRLPATQRSAAAATSEAAPSAP
jgi:hypothetical protein